MSGFIGFKQKNLLHTKGQVQPSLLKLSSTLRLK